MINKKIGIAGGGQLGKMMILEAKRLGLYTAVLDPASDCPAHSICDHHIVSPLDDPKGYEELAKRVDVITYEWENISADALENLERKGHVIYPSVTALKTIQNKYYQKTVLKNKGIPVPEFTPVNNKNDIRRVGLPQNFGYPLMLKAVKGGYDGKGNALIRNEEEIDAAFDRLNETGTSALMVEKYINFEKEISVIACRGINGEKVVYPVAENIHTDSILDTTVVPAGINNEMSMKAADIANEVMSVFEGVGTFCVEMFVTGSGDIYVNEVAPRPHNSGHYTIEACFANQFENHIRAIIGLPFGSTELITPVVMVNLLGESNGPAKLYGLEEAYRDPKVRVHFYGKSESKTGRKMGHYTVTGTTREDALQRAQALKDIIRVTGK